MFHSSPTRITGTLHEHFFTFMTISRRILLRMRNVLDKICREITHFIFNNFLPKIAPFMRERRKMRWSQRGHKRRHNMAHNKCMLDKQGYMHAHAHAPGHTHKYVILIAFPQQQLFRDHASLLRYRCTVCLVNFNIINSHISIVAASVSA